MKPPVVHQPVPPPQPPEADPAAPAQHEAGHPPKADTPGLVGSLGPVVGSTPAPDSDGAGADERKAP